MTESIPHFRALFSSPRVIWLAPNELVRSQLRREALASLESAGSLARPAPRLESFSSLEALLTRELPFPEVDDLTRRFLLNDLARPLARKLWPESASDGPAPADLQALADDLGDGFDRLKLAGLTWDQVASLPPGDLGPFLADLGRRHDARLAGLGRRDRFDRRRRMLEELQAGRTFRALAGVEEIVCRWCQRLSPFETDFLLALARGRQVRLTLTVPAWVRDENIDHGSGFDLLRTIRRIEKCDQPGLWLDFAAQTDAPAAPALAYAAETLLAPAAYRLAEPPDPADQLRIVKTPTAYHEVEAAARRLKESLAAGLAPEDLALVIPNLDRYGPLIDDVGRRFGLAFHFRRGTPLSGQGPARAVLDLLALWSSDWERPRLLNLIRSPYFSLDIDLVAAHRLALAAGVTDRRAGGGFGDNLDRMETAGPDRHLARRLANLVRELTAARSELDEAGDWPAFILWFKELLNRLGWPGPLDRAPETPLNIRGADLASAAAFGEELDRLATALAGSREAPPVGLDHFRLWLETVLTERHLSWDRDPEGRIRVLNYYDLHGGIFDEIFFLGVNERVFPQTAPETRWWPEEFTRAAAGLLGRPLWTEAADRYRQEELLLAAGLGQARRRVWLFHHAVGEDAGRLALPSPLLAALAELWPDGAGGSRLVEETVEWTSAPPLARAAGPDELRVALMRSPPADWPADLPNCAEHQAMAGELRRRRDRWRALKNEARPGPEAVRLWLSRRPGHQGSPLMRPAFLAAFAECPLAFWAREVLGLADDGEPLEEWPSTSEGTLIHGVLEKFFRARLGADPNQPGPPWPGQADFEACRAELLAILEEELRDRDRREPLGRLPLWRLRRDRLPDFLTGWLRREMAPDREPTRPWRLEWSFGPAAEDQAAPWPLPVGDGEVIYFHGRVDRLDQAGPGVAVRDYKLRDHRDFRLRTKDGARIIPTKAWPLLVYALAASRASGRPAEAWFEIIDPAAEAGRVRLMDTDQPEMAGPKEGVFSFPGLLAAAWRGVTAGVFPAESGATGCEWCSLKLFCPRRDGRDAENGRESEAES